MNKIKKLAKKVSTIIFTIFFTFYSLFGSLLVAFAEENSESFVGRATSDLNVRSVPTTAKNEDGSSNKIGEIADDSIMTVLSKTKYEGSGCSEGWYKVRQGELEGYVCSRYVTDASSDSYNRPWTTPKKAIMGGAKFISKSYIAKGQYTSYLKKFNVNPDAYYKVYTHQYMANLAAPSSEALSSYKTYNANNLFALPLEFSIPVFLNMEDKYNRPVSNLAEIEVLDEVQDEEFENKLNEQEFPDSYKKILRALHVKYPNWIFKNLKTGLDFKEAVAVEKSVSSIQGGNAYYDLSSGSAVSTEKGWYLANDETVSYYLDPRNFLTEKYILQFESLQNSDNYDEKVVQTVLDGTFMAEYSLIDNQTYASIFVEAGKAADMSSVYLASLAKQESGTKLGSNTNGAEFVYDGVTYSGLFNFFNIGAYSSAANPSKAGLVYASGGYCTICSANFVPPTPTPEEIITTTPTEEVIEPEVRIPTAAEITEKMKLTIKDKYIVGVKVGTKASELKKIDSSVEISTDVVTTGTVIKFPDQSSYTVVVYGDISGDGKINSADLLKLRKHLLNSEPLSGAYLESAQLTGDNKINSADLLRLRQYLLGTATIEQK